MSEQPATSVGTTRPAGDGVDDEEFTEEIGRTTSSDLKVEGAFEREDDGAVTDVEAAKMDADEASA